MLAYTVGNTKMLSIKNIQKRFGSVHAMNNISFDLKPGLFGLLGPNGAGKSTLMRTLATLQKPDSGTITYNGVNILHDPDIIRSGLGYLPQDFGVYPKMSALALLDHIAILKGIINKAERKEQIETLLQMVNLWTHKSASVATFSGGMKQRFGVAQALIGDPNLIIVDEPTAGLDPMERNRFHNLLSEIGENVIVILSTDIVDDVRDLCNDMAIILNGEVQVMGEPIELIKALNGKVWNGLVDKKDVVKIEEENQVISSRLNMGKVQVRVYSDIPLDNGFEKVDAEIEDLYFSTIHGLKINGIK